MKNQRLADVAPAGGGTEVVNEQQQQQHEGDAGRGVDGVDQEHHDGAAHDAQHTRVPGEVAERGPEQRTDARGTRLDTRVGAGMKIKNRQLEQNNREEKKSAGRIGEI